MSEDVIKNDVRILIVEDNEVNSKIAKRMLSKLGFQCDLACNGQEGIDMLCRETYHIVLMDLQMPVMDGIAATRWIFSNQDKLSHVPYIIALTANCMAEDRKLCAEVGMVDFIAKPIKIEILGNSLEKWAVLATEELRKA